MPHRRPSSPPTPSALLLTGDGRDTDRLKAVPADKAVRERIQRRAVEKAGQLDKTRALARHEMEALVRELLGDLTLPETYLGWTMVALASAFWQDQVAAVPFHRRLLLLPKCLRAAEVCPADCNETGLLCQDCGACQLTDLRAEARRKGYHVLIAEGSPAVMKIILSGGADALLGVACLDALEKMLDKVLLAGIPCMAVPLLCNGCCDTSVDADWIRRMFHTPHRPAAVQTRTYLHLMRCAAQMFEPAELERLLPRVRGGPSLVKSNGRCLERNGPGLEGIEPVACTEAIAYDFLAAGGKHSRPFITLAVYDALRGGDGTTANGAEHVAQLPDAVKRMALAIEIFHKASLVHDDIEDDDAFRYGRPTVHKTYGKSTAINVGDYLVGLGYRTVACQRDSLPADMVADVLAQFARAHTKLCEGQGAELIWRDARDKNLPPLDALKIYALKTAPAFEAALMAGIRLAGPVEPYHEAATRFSRHLGIAYQIVNDLDDWQGSQSNKCASGTDILGGRPTVLWALAMQGLGETDRHKLQSLLDDDAPPETRMARAAALYARADVYRQAAVLISKHHQRARTAADEIGCEPLTRLLHFLADAILDRRPLAINEAG
ncbi:MAG: polyprenyl synthetase family protein [Pirellulales bacterium]|nr:polyprenyl synthetase family protein [Pirellulales bacterium]